MKATFAVLSTILFSVLSINPSFAQSRPVCASATSDTDGDGYGWENEQTCIVAVEQSQCEDRGGFPWGWNATTLTSCRLDEQPLGETRSTDLVDLFAGTWDCSVQGDFIDGEFADFGWVDFDDIKSNGGPQGGNYNKAQLVFSGNKLSIFSPLDLDTMTFQGPLETTWKIENLQLLAASNFSTNVGFFFDADKQTQFGFGKSDSGEHLYIYEGRERLNCLRM